MIKCAWGIIPAAVLIFLVLGTIMMGLATPTEAGAMGTIGAIVLAAVRKRRCTTGRKVMFIGGCVAAGVGVLIGDRCFKSDPVQDRLHRHVIAVIWLCWAGLHSGPARPDHAGYQTTMRITAMVAFILVGATCFSITFQGVDGNSWVEHI